MVGEATGNMSLLLQTLLLTIDCRTGRFLNKSFNHRRQVLLEAARIFAGRLLLTDQVSKCNRCAVPNPSWMSIKDGPEIQMQGPALPHHSRGRGLISDRARSLGVDRGSFLGCCVDRLELQLLASQYGAFNCSHEVRAALRSFLAQNSH